MNNLRTKWGKVFHYVYAPGDGDGPDDYSWYIGVQGGWLFPHTARWMGEGFNTYRGLPIPIDCENLEELKVWLETAYALDELPKVGKFQYE
jgi:hypothetical protein